MKNATRGATGDVAGPISEAFARVDSVAQQFNRAEGELLRVRRVLESRYDTMEFPTPHIH
jgi:hypothetical protein